MKRLIHTVLLAAIVLALALPASLTASLPTPNKTASIGNVTFAGTYSTTTASPSQFPLLVAESHLRYAKTIDLFDVQAFLKSQNSFLATYSIQVGSEKKLIAQVIAEAAVVNGINPRVLLALMQVRSTAITGYRPDTGLPDHLLGPASWRRQEKGFDTEANWAASLLSEELERAKWKVDPLLVPAEKGQDLRFATNPSSYAIYKLASEWGVDDWYTRLLDKDSGFVATYEQWFGDPLSSPTFLPAVNASVSVNWLFPYAGSVRYTSGPHTYGPPLCGAARPRCTYYVLCQSMPCTDANALDFAVSEKTHILAIDSGEVVTVANTLEWPQGKFVIIEHDKHNDSDPLIASYYMHMRASNPALRVGMHVPRGFYLGEEGDPPPLPSGDMLPHLHLEIRQDGSDDWWGAKSGVPLSWEGLQINGWQIGMHKVLDLNTGTATQDGYAYQGSGIQGSTTSRRLKTTNPPCTGRPEAMMLVSTDYPPTETEEHNWDPRHPEQGGSPNTVFAGADPGGRTRSLQSDNREVDESSLATARGLQYLRQHQRPDGSWGESQYRTGITALAALAFLNYGFDERDSDVREAISFLFSKYEEIDANTGRFGGDVPWSSGEQAYTYDTSLGMLVLIAADRTNNPHEYTTYITQTKNYLLSIQCTQGCDSNNYGGWGYPRTNWSDLSNTQWAVMALDAAFKYLNLPKPDLADTTGWTNRVLQFADKVQRSDGNNNGGFDYRVGHFNQSVGSMSHAGIWTNLLAGRDPTDTHVQRAIDWVQGKPPIPSHWSETENPGRGSAALYYYYVTMTKALAMARKATLTVGGEPIDWFQKLYTELTIGGHKPTQEGDGSYWSNSNTEEWEYDENLVTAYAILALETHTLPPGVPLSMSIILHSPADLHLYDAMGRHTGRNYETGQIDLQIPGSTYSEAEPKTITVSQPEAGNYTVQLIGTGSGSYTLDIVGRQSGQVVSSSSYPGTITSGAAQGSFLSVTAIEGALTIFSTPPEPLPVMRVQPSSLTLQGAPGSTLHGTFAVQETGAVRGIQGISIFASDLTDGSGHTIPGSNITFQPNAFDLAAGASQDVAITVPLDAALPNGYYSGSITVESVNAGAKAVQISVNLSSLPGPLPDKFLFAIGAWAPMGLFNYPFGVGLAPDGKIYVADTDNHRVQYFSPTGTFQGAWGGIGSGDGQFNYPHGVSVAADGTVYVLDSGNNRVQLFTSTGQFLGKWGEAGSGDGQFWHPWCMTVAPDGTVYVVDSQNHRIQHFSATGTFLGKWGSKGSGDGQLLEPHGIVVTTDGSVYVGDYNNRIQHFTSAGVFQSKWGSYGTGDGQLNGPTGIVVGPDDTIYVADRWNHRIQRFSTTGQFLGKWGSFGSDDGQFDAPTGLVITSGGTVYVTESENGRIQYFSSVGQLLGKFGSYSSGDGQFHGAASVAVSGAGNIYVADRWNNRVQEFGADGHFIRQWTRVFNDPRGIAIDNASNVYVADSSMARIQKFTGDGVFLLEWGSFGDGDGQFSEPIGIAVGRDNTVYVADEQNHRIQRFSSTGQFLGKWGSYGSGDGQFNYPRGVAVASDGTIYVADSVNHRIQRFSANGQFLGKWGSFGNGDGQFNSLHSVTVALDSTVYVADINNQRIQRFSATGQFMGKWGSPGGGDGQFNYPQGVAVALDGTVYVADNYNHRIQAFGTAYPTTWRGEYFANRWLAERPVLIRQGSIIDFNWGTGSPGSSVPADNFSARWQRYFLFDAGTYRFTVFADDGVRLWVDNRLLIDQWQDQVGTCIADTSLTQGYHRVQLDYYETTGSAAVRLSWGPTTQNVAVAINPASKSATVGEVFSLDVRIGAGSQPVDAVDSYMSFDRNYLRVVDASGNETNSITPGATLSVTLQNSADNSQGRITYSAGKQLGGVSPSGDFVLATIRFKAVAAIGGGGTNVTFLSGTGVFYQGNSLPIFINSGNVQIQEAISLKGRVTLQGRGNPPDSRWNNFPLVITLYSPGGTSPVGSYTANTDASGYFTVTGITPGTYDVKVKNAHTLSNKKANVTVPTGPTAVDFGTLLEGDANNDDNVGGADYSILATAYGRCSGQSGWDSRADFNGSGCIDGADYSLLANSYGRHGPIALAITAMGPVETEVITGSVVISVDPSSKSVTPETIFTLDIKIAASSQAVDAADSYLSFDRNYLRVVDASGNETNSIVSGTTLSVTLQNSADNSQGRIAYSAGKQLGGVSPSGDFVLATIRFKAIAAPPGGGTAITFQSGTDAFYQGDSVLGALVNGAVSAGYRAYLPVILRVYQSW